jgi:hypothetical protein
MLRDAGSMTTLTPPSSRVRRGGILYGQMYSLTKEIIDAARTFPFQNRDLRDIALDPRLHHGAQNISRKPQSGRSVVDRAYLASKRRYHYGLMDIWRLPYTPGAYAGSCNSKYDGKGLLTESQRDTPSSDLSKDWKTMICLKVT